MLLIPMRTQWWQNYESNKFSDDFDPFDAFDSNAQAVVTEHYKPNKLYHAFHAYHIFDSNAQLVVAKTLPIKQIL